MTLPGATGQVHFPAQQHADVLFGQQLFFGKVLHQVRRYIQVPGTQCLYGRWRHGWRGRSAVNLTLIGMGVLLLAFFGTKAVLELILHRTP